MNINMRHGLKVTLTGNECLTIKKKIKMKKIYSLMVAVIAVVSCNKELINNDIQGEGSGITFKAIAEASTKTILGKGGAVTWNTGDKISVNGTEFITEETTIILETDDEKRVLEQIKDLKFILVSVPKKNYIITQLHCQ